MDLESLTPGLFETCDETLGDTISVTPPSASPLMLKATVDFGEATQAGGISNDTVQAIRIELRKALVPGKPLADWRVTIPHYPGLTFSPRATETDESGRYWSFGVKVVPV